MQSRITFSLHETPRDRVDQIIKAVSERTGVDVPQIMDTAHRSVRVTRARWQAWTDVRNAMGWSYPRVARIWGTDHTSVIYGVRKLAAEKAAQEMEQST